ncbi:restriction endonuclease subunit S [Zhaonella formicivorans]|uniref:restriction endonuclease subunit S n=1 Tax=Zhaonella formicivorans TaxID=2528593 RepID=UPI001D119E7F|nr:restriction endonuclease subunit S [Zhaonella formicivorans]
MCVLRVYLTGVGSELINEKDRLKENDIIIARGNKIDQVGNAGVVPKEAEGWVCANLLMRMQVNPEKVDPFFCIYWLRSPKMRQHIKKTMKGTNPNIQKINQQNILAFPFPMGISLDKQRKIVSLLSRIEDRIETVRQLQTESEKEIDILFSSILHKFLY